MMRPSSRAEKITRPTKVRGGVRCASGEDKLTSADFRALAEFRYQIRRFLNFSERAARAEGLEPQQHQMLVAIRTLDRPDIRKLADYLLIRHHSAVGLIDRLEERRLVERHRNGPDRRQVHVVLTPEGEKRLSRLSVKHRAQLRRSGAVLVQALRNVLEGWPLGAVGSQPNSKHPKEENVAEIRS